MENMEGNNSIFNKINEIKDDKVESENTGKEQMYEETRQEIKDLEQKKEEYKDLCEKISSQKSEFTNNRANHDAALQGVLNVFDNEEAKKILAEQEINGIKDLLNKYPDTDEAKNLNNSENSVKENIANLKEMKAGVIGMFDIKNPNYKTLRGVINYLDSKIRATDEEIRDKSIDTPEGRESWPVYYEYYENNDFEKDVKENKEPKLREIYHELGDKIDAAMLESIKDYNSTVSDSDDMLKMKPDYKEGRHVISRSSIGINGDTIKFYFGAGYSSLEYKINNHNGRLFFSRKDSYKSILPDGYNKIFNEKLRAVDASFKSVAESI